MHASLDFRDLTQLATWWLGDRFDNPTCQVLEEWLKEQPAVFFDIGANYGFFSFLAASRHPKTLIHAFEPHPKTFQYLTTIRERNNLNRLSCWNLGLGDRNEELRLHPGTEDMGHTTFGAHPVYQEDPSLAVSIRAFSDWRREAAPDPHHPWIAKIDVEGFELKVLQGMRQELLEKRFRGLVIEINSYTLKFCGTSAKEVFSLLKDVGYTPLYSGDQRDNSNAFYVPT